MDLCERWLAASRNGRWRQFYWRRVVLFDGISGLWVGLREWRLAAPRFCRWLDRWRLHLLDSISR